LGEQIQEGAAAPRTRQAEAVAVGDGASPPVVVARRPVRMRTSRTVGRIESAKAATPQRRHLRMPDLIEIVGEANAVRLCRAFPGARIPPLLPWLQQKRMATVIQRWRDGYDVKTLSSLYRLSPITIRAIIRRYRQAHSRTSEDTSAPALRILRVGGQDRD
jgi:hypothetical protein